MTVLRRLRPVLLGTVAALAALLVTAAPAGAQQLVDAGGDNGQGGLAFVLLVVMVACIAGGLFYMDHVRRNRLPQDDDTQ
jgi:hypothetical protein